MATNAIFNCGLTPGVDADVKRANIGFMGALMAKLPDVLYNNPFIA